MSSAIPMQVPTMQVQGAAVGHGYGHAHGANGYEDASGSARRAEKAATTAASTTTATTATTTAATTTTAAWIQRFQGIVCDELQRLQHVWEAEWAEREARVEARITALVPKLVDMQVAATAAATTAATSASPRSPPNASNGSNGINGTSDPARSLRDELVQLERRCAAAEAENAQLRECVTQLLSIVDRQQQQPSPSNRAATTRSQPAATPTSASRTLRRTTVSSPPSTSPPSNPSNPSNAASAANAAASNDPASAAQPPPPSPHQNGNGQSRHLTSQQQQPPLAPLHAYISRDNQYSVKQQSGCTMLALYAVILLQIGSPRGVRLVDSVLAYGTRHSTLRRHYSPDELYAQGEYPFSRYLSLLPDDGLQVLVSQFDRVCMHLVDVSRRRAGASVSAVVVKEPESLTVHYDPVSQHFWFFDSHPRAERHGAALLEFADAHALTAYFRTTLFPAHDSHRVHEERAADRSGAENAALPSAVTDTTADATSSPDGADDAIRELPLREHMRFMVDVVVFVVRPHISTAPVLKPASHAEANGTSASGKDVGVDRKVVDPAAAAAAAAAATKEEDEDDAESQLTDQTPPRRSASAVRAPSETSSLVPTMTRSFSTSRSPTPPTNTSVSPFSNRSGDEAAAAPAVVTSASRSPTAAQSAARAAEIAKAEEDERAVAAQRRAIEQREQLKRDEQLARELEEEERRKAEQRKEEERQQQQQQRDQRGRERERTMYDRHNASRTSATRPSSPVVVAGLHGSSHASSHVSHDPLMSRHASNGWSSSAAHPLPLASSSSPSSSFSSVPSSSAYDPRFGTVQLSSSSFQPVATSGSNGAVHSIPTHSRSSTSHAHQPFSVPIQYAHPASSAVPSSSSSRASSPRPPSSSSSSSSSLSAHGLPIRSGCPRPSSSSSSSSSSSYTSSRPSSPYRDPRDHRDRDHHRDRFR